MRLAKLARLGLCAAAGAGLIVPMMGPRAFAAGGDPAAQAEAIAAFQKLNALPSYRINWTSAEGTGIIEFVQPDKRHFTGKGAKGSFEIFQIGTETRSHFDMPGIPGAPSGWRCSNSQRGPIRWFEVDKMREDTTTEVVRQPDTVIDGTPVHAYTDTKNRGDLYVGVQTGLPRRFVGVGKNGTFTADFYDYGAPITFAPPPCP